MCGLAGAFGLGGRDEVRRVAVRRMVAALCHRGPDDEGLLELGVGGRWSAGTLGHRRLSILDLSSSGHQPMLHASGRLTIVFNGEIYNYRALRQELIAEGAAFASESDTEVLLEGWARHGESFLPRLRGMFAFAIWDGAAGRAYLVRDRFGIKPLYVAETANGLLFASELRAILETGLVERTLEPAAIAGYLAQGSVPEPLTAVRGVRALPAGTVTTVDVADGTGRISKPKPFATMFAAPAQPPERDPRVAARIVSDALADSVAHHLVSDVPVALFLSGGIDSSAVVAFASEASGERLHTFTITFRERGYDESGPASAVARRYSTDHEEVPLAASDLLRSLPAALAAMDQPSLDGLNTFAVSAAVRRAGYKVVLSGLGGDEMFAGYPSFRRAKQIAPFWGRGTGAARRGVASLAALADGGRDPRRAKLALALRTTDPARAAFMASRGLFAGAGLTALVGGEHWSGWEHGAAEPPAGLSLLQRVSWYELAGYMRNTLLRDSDVLSMAHGLELRVPFIDSAVAGASTAVDDDCKLAHGVSKPLLVAALGGRLPREVWDRPKRGFELPFARWLGHELREEVGRALTSDEGTRRVGLDAGATRDVWLDFLGGRAGVSWSRPWALYTLIRWAEHNDLAVPRGEEGRAHGAREETDQSRDLWAAVTPRDS